MSRSGTDTSRITKAGGGAAAQAGAIHATASNEARTSLLPYRLIHAAYGPRGATRRFASTDRSRLTIGVFRPQAIAVAGRCGEDAAGSLILVIDDSEDLLEVVAL